MILIPGLLRFLKRVFFDGDPPVYPIQVDPNKLNTVADIARYLWEKGETLKPASPNDVRQVESKFNVKLPFAYREFLNYMGRGASRFMVGSSVFMNELLELYDGALELCEENNITPIPENAFVFWMHQGYQALYFLPGEEEDPAIYYYHEGSGATRFEKQPISFIDFLKTELVNHYPELKEKIRDGAFWKRVDENRKMNERSYRVNLTGQ